MATLDGRTCLICGADDGKLFSKDDTKPSLPRHVSCRCLYVPTFEDSPPMPRPATKHSSRKVHHRDGSTSTKLKVASSELTTENYNQWLQRQLKEDPAFVKRILGKTRFELFAKGGLVLQKMIVDKYQIACRVIILVFSKCISYVLSIHIGGNNMSWNLFETTPVRMIHPALADMSEDNWLAVCVSPTAKGIVYWNLDVIISSNMPGSGFTENPVTPASKPRL